MTIRRRVLAACVAVACVPVVFANGGGSMSMPQIREQREQSPQEKAHAFYNEGVHDVKKADKYQSAAQQASDPTKKDKAQREALEYYSGALGKFQQAADTDPQMPEAWNYVGYTSRKLGNYEVALTAYERALSLKPGFPDALEYRGEAFLGLNRVSDAQQAYLDLFAGNRALADKLLTAMRSWLDAQRAAPTATAQTVDDMDKWIQERTAIAHQTAALTREGTAANWK